MFGSSVSIPRSSSHELTPRDDAKKMVSEVLKRADQLIRKGELDQAGLEICKAKEIDPRNVYALALEERIYSLRTERENSTQKRKKNEIVTTQPKENPKETTVISRVTVSTISHNTGDQIEPTVSVSKPVPSPIAIATRHEETGQERVVERSIELESYRKTLIEAWSDGALNPDEERQLHELQSILEITDAEHEGMEKNVKRECYKNAIVRQMTNNGAALSDSKSVTDLKRMFNISDEEHMQVQAQLMDFIQQKQRDKVLVIDDDTRLLEMLTASLENNGFDVTALSTSDEAFALLRKFAPDLILCDINLETSTMGGFTFYEKVQELKNAQSVPFVFLTGLTDETLVRTGKELGVDDYLVKPISEQTLVSTLRGKLKRFKQLRHLAGSQLFHAA
jgi:CheY-like chemotaxis protein